MIELSESRIYEFEGFRLDGKRQRLFQSASGELVPLTPKAVEVLLYLVENAGRVLTKDEILEAVWENSFVEESNLSQTIFVLRKTLGEDTKKPRFILTAPNRGYQFIAPVKKANADDEILEETFLSDSQDKKQRAKGKGQGTKLLWFAVPLILLLAVGIYWFYPKSPKPVTVREIKTIAVLPFEDLSAEQTEKYLGVSLADALTNKFGNLNEIIVRPTRTVLKYAEKREDAQKIGRELQVDAVLDGRIQRIGERIRVNVQLIRTADNATIWSEKFDDNFTNFFAVQDSISQQVVQALALQINEKEREKLIRHGTQNAAAYQDYLRGRFFWNKRTPENLNKAIIHFEQATQKDSKFALAYTGLADCYLLLPEYYAATTHESFPKAKIAVQKALELDNQSAEAHTSLGYIQAFYDWNLAGAESSFKRAIEINPNYATAHQWYAELLSNTGRFDESHTHFERALQSDPTSPIILIDVAANYYLQERYDETIAQAKKVIELEPNFAYGHYYLGFAFERQKLYAEASDALADSMTFFGEPPESAAEVRAAFKQNGMPGWWQKRLEQIENRPYLKFFPAYSKAFVYARVGNKEKALEFLNKSYEQRERFLMSLRYSKDFELLKDDPRFQDLLRRMKL